VWVDYTGKVETTNNQNVASSNWMTLPRDGFPSSASAQAGLSPRASGTSNLYKPVPFPGVGLVVWFGPSEMRFRGPDSTTYTISYPSSISSACRPPSSTTYNVMIMITDGISSVTMGRRSGTTIGCLAHVAFDWSASTYDATMLTVTPIANNNQVSNWHNTEQDANSGDLLWTVNGKPAWYSSGRMHLGTGMAANVFQSSSSSAVSVAGSGNTQHGLDIFIRVTTDGILWVGDWGHDNGGMFGCGNDNYLGIAPTNIKLASACDAVSGFYSDASSGYKYATMDGTSYDSTSWGCQSAYLNLPTGWELAPYDSDGIRIAKVGKWGASVMVYSNGKSYWTGSASNRFYNSGMLLTRTLNGAPAYKPNVCNGRVLIRTSLSC